MPLGKRDVLPPRFSGRFEFGSPDAALGLGARPKIKGDVRQRTAQRRRTAFPGENPGTAMIGVTAPRS